MSLIAVVVVRFGIAEIETWRYCKIIAGAVCFLMWIVYCFFIQDSSNGNYKKLKSREDYRNQRKMKLVLCQQ